MKKPTVSIIVCTYDENRIKDLDECINSLLRQQYNDFEILIVVDHNEDLYRVLVGRYNDQRIRIILNTLERGQAASMNQGIINARGEIVCFIDDDAIADESWLLELVKNYDKETYAVGGCIKPLWLSEKPSYLPEEFYWMIGATGNYLPDQVTEVRNLWSGNISYRKEVFNRIGLFSQDLGLAGDPLFQGEDAEFGLRLLKATGKSVKYVPTAVVYHKVYADRIKIDALFKRAYEQGFAKAYIWKCHGGTKSLSVEHDYLKFLVKSCIRKLKRLVFGPYRIQELSRLAFIILATTTVIIGFIIGLFKART